MLVNRLRKYESKAIATISAMALGAISLAGCGGGKDGIQEKYANCDLAEIQGWSPVVMGEHAVDPSSIAALREAIRKYPSVLIDTARNIHPSRQAPKDNLLKGQYDRAHDNDVSPQGVEDRVDNPGDIVCEISPFGDSGNDKRRIYYDYDGQRLYRIVDSQLDKIKE